MPSKDPGNSQPEDWTEDLPEEEQKELRRLIGLPEGEEKWQ